MKNPLFGQNICFRVFPSRSISGWASSDAVHRRARRRLLFSQNLGGQLPPWPTYPPLTPLPSFRLKGEKVLTNFGSFKLSFLKISVWVIPTTINCCLILPTNPQYFISLIFKNVATNLSFEYAWFLSNFGLNVSKFRIRQSSDYWVEKSQVALLFSIASI